MILFRGIFAISKDVFCIQNDKVYENFQATMAWWGWKCDKTMFLVNVQLYKYCHWFVVDSKSWIKNSNKQVKVKIFNRNVKAGLQHNKSPKGEFKNE